MKFYADLPSRRLLQVAGDLGLVAWIALWAWLGRVVHDATAKLAGPGHRVEEASSSLAERLREAGAGISDVPLVGDEASRPFDGAGDAAERVAAAGRAQVEAAQTLADWLGLVVAVAPILLLLGWYLPPRIRFVRRASAGRALVDSAADLDLFALRALAHQPLHVLARVSPDPARAWRERDSAVVGRLAALELRAAGLRPPGGAGDAPPHRSGA